MKNSKFELNTIERQGSTFPQIQINQWKITEMKNDLKICKLDEGKFV